MERNGYTPSEVLTIARIREWSQDRFKLSAGHTTAYKRQGWQQRTLRQQDARLVRVLDFERAISQLTGEEQMILLLTYRDRQPARETAKVMHCSERTINSRIRPARLHLTAILERLDLL